MSRRGCSLLANASGFDPHGASISSCFGQVTAHAEALSGPLKLAMLVLAQMRQQDSADRVVGGAGERCLRLLDEDRHAAARNGVGGSGGGQGALLDSFCWEVLRHADNLVTAAPIFDTLLTAASGVYSVRRGSLLAVSTALACRDPTLWAEPHRFRPNRFVGADAQRQESSVGWVRRGRRTAGGRSAPETGAPASVRRAQLTSASARSTDERAPRGRLAADQRCAVGSSRSPVRRWPRRASWARRC
jgi:hypothetical protein